MIILWTRKGRMRPGLESLGEDGFFSLTGRCRPYNIDKVESEGC